MDGKIISLVSLLLFFQNVVASQDLRKEKVYYDTVKLPEPKLGKEDIASPEDYDRCINISNDLYYVQLDKKRHTMTNESELDSFVRKNKKEMTKLKFSIISDSKTKYETIINTLDVLVKHNISNYRLVFADDKLPPSNPLVVESKKPFTKDINLADSTVFIISITDTGFETSLLNEKILHLKTSDIDSYITKKTTKISQEKIVITAPGSARYDRVEPVIMLLKKHHFTNYHLIPIN